MNAKKSGALTVSDLPLVLALARGRTLAAAAESLDVDVSTVFRRLEALEKRLRVRLFDRSPRGYQLTDAGERASDAAERIETEVHALDREISGRDQQLEGTLRITASETLSHAVLPKLFAQFRTRHPRIQLALAIDNRVLDLSRREADVALRTRRPSDNALFGRKLANIAWAFYGAAEGSKPLKKESGRLDFSHHDVIGWDDPASRVTASEWVLKNVPSERVVYRSSSLVNQLMSVRAAVGVALLPCYLADPDPGVRRITAPIGDVAGELWIVTHKDLKETARIRSFLTIVGDGIAAHRKLFEGSGSRAST